MPGKSHIIAVRIYPLAIPLRKTFRHAAHERRVADPVVIEVELADGTLGYGETLPRSYVSGETVESVIVAIQDEMLDELLAFRPERFADALERIDALPMQDELGRMITAARAGLELALLDAYSRHFGKPISHAVGWLGYPGLGMPGSLREARYSGVIGGGDARRLKTSVLKMRLFGLRDFKLKVGYTDDVERIRIVADALGRSLGRSCTLRLDANGGWEPQEAVAVLSSIGDLPIPCVEQPLSRGREPEIPALKRAVTIDIMHDESLVTPADAERLLNDGVADAFNIRISKNGGFLASLRLAHFARKHDVDYQLGCMVGETSILSAAGRRFLENVPGVMFSEGSYGRFLLSGDVVDRPVRFGFGGKFRALSGPGWGVEVRRDLLDRYVRPGRIELPL